MDHKPSITSKLALVAELVNPYLQEEIRRLQCLRDALLDDNARLTSHIHNLGNDHDRLRVDLAHADDLLNFAWQRIDSLIEYSISLETKIRNLENRVLDCVCEGMPPRALPPDEEDIVVTAMRLGVLQPSDSEMTESDVDWDEQLFDV